MCRCDELLQVARNGLGPFPHTGNMPPQRILTKIGGGTSMAKNTNKKAADAGKKPADNKSGCTKKA